MCFDIKVFPLFFKGFHFCFGPDRVPHSTDSLYNVLQNVPESLDSKSQILQKSNGVFHSADLRHNALEIIDNKIHRKSFK